MQICVVELTKFMYSLSVHAFSGFHAKNCVRGAPDTDRKAFSASKTP